MHCCRHDSKRSGPSGGTVHFSLIGSARQALNSLIVFLSNVMAFTDPPSIMGWYGSSVILMSALAPWFTCLKFPEISRRSRTHLQGTSNSLAKHRRSNAPPRPGTPDSAHRGVSAATAPAAASSGAFSPIPGDKRVVNPSKPWGKKAAATNGPAAAAVGGGGGTGGSGGGSRPDTPNAESPMTAIGKEVITPAHHFILAKACLAPLLVS